MNMPQWTDFGYLALFLQRDFQQVFFLYTMMMTTMKLTVVVAALALTTIVSGQEQGEVFFSLSSSTANATANETDVTTNSETVTGAFGDAALATALSSSNALSNKKDDGGFTPAAASLSDSTSAILDGFVQTDSNTLTAVEGEGSLAVSQSDSGAQSATQDINGDFPVAGDRFFSLSSFDDKTGILASQSETFAAGEFAKSEATLSFG
eukprot:TRINITY_DN11005_c0_g4_i1.p1 TRINITY_DN11005_c0_g4~~TRINITY_DN11005_c0_g4_i1.p1  ORF type:complete len:208 (-),score=45.63 TRINITY_DN11005_c0_g4_i1:230-853(-)